MLQCSKCKLFKNNKQFHKTNTSRGRNVHCKSCRSDHSKEYYRRPERHAYVMSYIHSPKEMDRRRAITWKYEYGITKDDYVAMFTKQEGVCAICGYPERRKNSRFLCADHCHKTGRIRGLLCHTCNSAVGKLNDDPVLLRNAITYLERNDANIGVRHGVDEGENRCPGVSV